MNSLKSGLIAALVAVAVVCGGTKSFARGGGHGGGGHGGGHAGGHHGGEHHGGEHHAYHPSSHHTQHHSSHHHSDHHHNHHHHSWHHGGWGPGFWGGAALGAGLGYWGGAYAPWGYGGDGGYVNNTYNNAGSDNDNDDSDDNDSDDSDNAQPQTLVNNTLPGNENSNANAGANSPANARGFATDDWPELGIVTYAGQYGKSQGLVVVKVVPNSAGAKAGLVGGDVILRLNGVPTPNCDALEVALDAAKGQFTATVWDARTGRTSDLTGALDPAPADLKSDADENAAAQPVALPTVE